jgi:hypothetical protein
MLRMSHCLDNRLTDGGKIVRPTHRPRSTSPKHYFYVSGTNFCNKLSKPQSLVRPGYCMVALVRWLHPRRFTWFLFFCLRFWLGYSAVGSLGNSGPNNIETDCDDAYWAEWRWGWNCGFLKKWICLLLVRPMTPCCISYRNSRTSRQATKPQLSPRHPTSLWYLVSWVGCSEYFKKVVGPSTR